MYITEVLKMAMDQKEFTPSDFNQEEDDDDDD
jgi:hypothetical protein